MAELSTWHWLILFLPMLLLFGIPVARILKRAGLNPWWMLVILLPLLNVVGLWIFAFIRWPALDERR